MRATQTRGFTLIELCCVVGILGILTSLGTASYGSYVRRAQASEAVINVETLAYLEQARILEAGAPIACAREPAKLPSADHAVPFVAGPCWRDLGFKPSARVRFQYETELRGERGFIVTARGDLDGDGVPTVYSIDGATMLMARENVD